MGGHLFWILLNKVLNRAHAPRLRQKINTTTIVLGHPPPPHPHLPRRHNAGWGDPHWPPSFPPTPQIMWQTRQLVDPLSPRDETHTKPGESKQVGLSAGFLKSWQRDPRRSHQTARENSSHRAKTPTGAVSDTWEGLIIFYLLSVSFFGTLLLFQLDKFLIQMGHIHSKALLCLRNNQKKLCVRLKGAFKVPFFSSQNPVIPHWVTQIKDLSRRWDTASAGTLRSSPSTPRTQTHNVHVTFRRLDEGPNHPLWSINANISNCKYSQTSLEILIPRSVFQPTVTKIRWQWR